MTRKDYMLIAEAVREELEFLRDMHGADVAKNSNEGIAIQNVACTLAVKLKTQNSQFDRDRFLRACGLDV